MEVEKLKKRLLREELNRRRRRSPYFRLLQVLLLVGVLVAAGALYQYYAAEEERLHRDFARAELHVSDGAFSEAVELYRSIFDRNPGFTLSPKALFRAGEVQNYYLKQFHDALLTFHLLEQEYPDSVFVLEALKQEAGIYKDRLRDYGRATALYQKLVDLGVSPADHFQYELADCYFRLNNFEQALIKFANLQKSWPQSPLHNEVFFRMGVTYALDGQLAEAENILREFIRNNPHDTFYLEAKFSLAAVLEEQERLREALKILEELVDSYPNQEALQKRIDQVKERIDKKKRAV